MSRSESDTFETDRVDGDKGEARRPGATSDVSRSEKPSKGAPGRSDEAHPGTDHPDAEHGTEADEDAGDDAGDAARDDASADQQARKKRRPVVLVVSLLVLAALGLCGAYYFLSTRNIEDTDDAFTDGFAVQIAPQVAGRVVSLDVMDNQFVRRGQALVHIDPRQFINTRDQAQGMLDTAKAQLTGQRLSAEVAAKNFPAALQVAQANLAAAKATLEQRQADFARQKSLPKQATTQQDVDSATSNLQNAQAQVLLMQARVVQAEPVKQQIGESQQQVSQLQGQVEQAQSQLNQANLNLSYTVVRAPQDGWVTRRQVDLGAYVQTGQQILALVSPDVWVTANFKETQLDLMRPGQSVRIRVDAYPDLDLRGHVDSIQLGSGSKFSAFPAENATGNFVKIVQRVPVKILIDSGLDPTLPLPLGISVDPKVTVR